MAKIPIVYAYLYYRLKKSTRTDSINAQHLKEALSRALVRASGGFPRFLIKYVTEDLISLNLIKRIDCRTYCILNNNCGEKIRKKLLVI